MKNTSVYEGKQLQRDNRHPINRFNDFLKTKDALPLIAGVYSMSYIADNFAVICYATTGVLLLLSRSRFTLPVHLPVFSKERLDFNNMRPVKKKNKNIPTAQPPGGVVYIGNIVGSNEQVWWDKALCCTHLFFLATTGGGKTFSFAGILSNFVIYSGFCYSDAKADLALIETYAKLMFRMGRINQLYVLSFQSGNRNPWDIRKSERISHSFNPAANGSAPMIAELFKALLDGDGDIWAKRGDNLSTVMIRPLTYMRDKYKWPMGFGQIASFFTLEKLGELCSIGEGRVESYPISENDKKYFGPLRHFLKTLPGLDEQGYLGLVTNNKELISKITQTTRDQLGYVTMQLVNVTNDLIGDYGHIFETMYGQINLEDALANRKVVITLLPALERSESTMSVLGRIALAAQKTIVANAQAFKLGGSLSEHIGSRPTMADVPYGCINDEAGSYMVDGVSANTAMARSANVFFAFGGQDLPAMKKRGGMIEKEVETIWGTTVNKMAGSILEASTINAFIEAADKVFRLEMTNFDVEDNGFYKRKIGRQMSVQERSVLTPRMLENQDAGQVQLLTRGTVRSVSLPNYRVKNFNKDVINFYITETIPVIPLPHELTFNQKTCLTRIQQLINSGNKNDGRRVFDNVFEDYLDQNPINRDPFNGIVRATNFFQSVMDSFEHDGLKKLNLFTAGAVILFYIDEFSEFTMRHISSYKWNSPTHHKLQQNHLKALKVLFGDRVEAAELDKHDEADDPFADSLSPYSGDADPDEIQQAAITELNDPSTIDAFQRRISALMDEEMQHKNAGTSVVSSETEKETTLVARVEDNYDHVDLFGLSAADSAIRDISSILERDELTSTKPTLTNDDSADQINYIDDDLAALQAVKGYQPPPYKTSKTEVIETIQDFLDSMKDNDEDYV